MGKRRPPEVKAVEATAHQSYWLANGMEVRPFKWDTRTETVMCSREISPGHRKRDFPVKFDTTLFTTPPLKAVEKAPPDEEEAAIPCVVVSAGTRTGRLDSTKPNLSNGPSDKPATFRDEFKVPTAGAPMPTVTHGAPPREAMQRMSALRAMRDAIDAALEEGNSSKWRFFLIAHHLNPELRCMKHILAQAELDMRSVSGAEKAIMEEVKNI